LTNCSDTNISRRTALTLLGSASLSLAAGLPLSAGDNQSDKLRNVLPTFSEKSRALLQRVLEGGYSGQITAADATELARLENSNMDALMVRMLPLAQSFSRAPISKFYVGVVVRGESGALYTGANIEIPGQCLGFAVHAEQSALANAYMHGENSIAALAVGGAPCGHCRQFINEMSPAGEIQILTPDRPPVRLRAILPEAFGPAALGRKDGALPVKESRLILAKASSDPTTTAALDAARHSYAPYSKSPSGVAIRSRSGQTYRGSYIENVAFNPSLSPLQTALVAMVAGGEAYSSIAAVTLVEVQGAAISQKPVTETVLGAIAPDAKLEVALALE
jgi:cytidine deaminase